MPHSVLWELRLFSHRFRVLPACLFRLFLCLEVSCIHHIGILGPPEGEGWNSQLTLRVGAPVAESGDLKDLCPKGWKEGVREHVVKKSYTTKELRLPNGKTSAVYRV